MQLVSPLGVVSSAARFSACPNCDAAKQQALPKPPTEAEHVAKAVTAEPSKTTMGAWPKKMWQWVAHFVKGFFQDLKLLLTGQ